MGSLWRVDILDRDKSLNEAPLKQQLEATLGLYERTFSDWDNSSELRRLEIRGLSRLQKASPLFLEGLKFSKTLYDSSGGIFDITTGALSWNELKNPVGLSSLEIFASSFKFHKDPKRLSFGGILKGQTTGAMARIIYSSGLREFSINGGGSSILNVNSEGVEFISSSSAIQQNGVQHIFDPRNPARRLQQNLKISCRYKFNSQSETTFPWEWHGAETDALTKVLLIQPKSMMLPKECVLL